MKPKKILFCTDFSENSEPAQQLASEYAKDFGAELLIVHVVDSSAFPSFVDWVGDEIYDILKRTKESAEIRLESVAKECGQVVGAVKTYCRVGSPQKEIIALANEESVDLIVVGTHGRAGVRHLFMGSIARNVLRTAHRPVLILEAPSGKGEYSEEPDEYPVP